MSCFGIYIGKNKQLKGKTALLQTPGPKTIQAQFDDLKLPRKYTHNWKTFSVKSFQITGTTSCQD